MATKKQPKTAVKSAQTVYAKSLYAVRPRTGSQSHVVSAMAHLRIFDKSLVEDTNVFDLLKRDTRVDAEFIKQFSDAIYETEEPVIIVTSNNQVRAIMSQGIEIGYDMPKYLYDKGISFANDSKTVHDAVARHLSFNCEIYICQLYDKK